MYLPSFPLNSKFFIFSENNGILLTISSARVNVNSVSHTGELTKELSRGELELLKARTTDTTAMAFAGVGSPRKSVDCSESRLNFARRNAAQTGITAGRKSRIE